MTKLKCYLKRVNGKLDAWVTGGFPRGPKVNTAGHVTLDGKDYITDSRKYVRVNDPAWWERGIPILTGFAGGVIGIVGGASGMFIGLIAGIMIGVVLKSAFPIEREIWGQLWLEGDSEARAFGGDETGTDRVSAAELRFANKRKLLAFTTDDTPPILIMLLLLIGGVVVGFVMGKV